MLHVIYLVACQLVSILQETSTLAAAETGIKMCSPVGATGALPTRLRKQHLFVISKDDLPSPFFPFLAPDLILTDSSRVSAAHTRWL